MIYSMDYLGGAMYPGVILKHHPKGFGAGFFAQEFGDAKPIVAKLLALGICPAIRIQIIWDNLHNYGIQHIPIIKKEARRYQVLAKMYPDVHILLSPFCEHNLQNPDKYLDIVKQEAPDCIPVNTIWKGKLSTKYMNEVHGVKAKAPKGKFIFSYDGNSSNQDPNIERMKERMKNAEIFFLWTAAFNLKSNDDDKTPIAKRWNIPTKEHLEAMKFLTTRKDG